MRDAGDEQSEFEHLLPLVAGDLDRLRDAIAQLSREDADALLLALMLRLASIEHALELAGA